jgi:quinol monooxygenase YgiN
MDEIQLIARFTLHEGKVKEFKALAKDCLTVIKEKDKGVLQYNWFFDEKESECVVVELYKDSAAVLNHVGLIGELLGKMMAMSDFSGEVYGNASAELKGALAGLNVKMYHYFQGL